jgi:hypothetical protein
MLEDELDLEADLGIDTVKQVEIFGKVAGELRPRRARRSEAAGSEHHRQAGRLPSGARSPPGSRPPPAAARRQQDAVVRQQQARSLPGLDPGGEGRHRRADRLHRPTCWRTTLDLEADLGIDTVKQVEIFGKVARERFGLSRSPMT